jgi:hypothetical protein
MMMEALETSPLNPLLPYEKRGDLKTLWEKMIIFCPERSPLF